MKYIVAVSGGVDSICLLDMLVNKDIDLPDAEFVVAHFDHGIRQESADDAEFVAGRAVHYGLEFETKRAELGETVSEELARQERYKFLHECRKKHNADAIITAHHNDDVIETAIFNILRGTNWRGLASLKSTDGILRPLLTLTKSDLKRYAAHNQLTWVEDSTNNSNQYSRNHIRNNLIPKLSDLDPQFKQKFAYYIDRIHKLQKLIDAELNILIDRSKVKKGKYIISRHKITMWPINVSLEYLRIVITKLDNNWHPTTKQLKQILNFCKSAMPGKTFEVSSRVIIDSTKSHLEFKKYH